MTDDPVSQTWPLLGALQESLDKLAEGTTVPIVMRADVARAQAQLTFMRHLRSQMFLAKL